MNDSSFQQDFANRPSLGGDVPDSEDLPQFGAVDIVEAFTAMRHEWRGQSRESRAVADQIEAAAANLQSLESKLLACVAENRADPLVEAKALVGLIVETDHQLSRAATAIAQWEANERQREATDAKSIERCFEAMSPLARWFARPLLTFLTEQRSTSAKVATHPALEGLNMVLARLRRTMHEQGIERLDVLGQPFDADSMHAIGTVASTDYPSGNVAEQLSAAYRWQGKLFRFADVRVAS